MLLFLEKINIKISIKIIKINDWFLWKKSLLLPTLYRLNSIYYCFSSEKLKLYWFWQGVRETKIDFDRGSGPECKTLFDKGSEPNQSPPQPYRPCPRMIGTIHFSIVRWKTRNISIILWASYRIFLWHYEATKQLYQLTASTLLTTYCAPLSSSFILPISFSYTISFQ